MAKKTKLAQRATLPKTVVAALPTSAVIAKEVTSIMDKIAKLDGEIEKAAKTSPVQLARAFVALRKLKDKMEDLEKAFSAVFIKAATATVPGKLEESGMEHVPLTEGFRVGYSSQLFVSVLKENREKAIEWLRNNGHGDIVTSGLVVSQLDEKDQKKLVAFLAKNKLNDRLAEAFNASTLSAMARHLLEVEGKELPEDIFKATFVKNTSVTVTG